MSDAEKALLDAGVRKQTVIVDWDGTCVPSAWPERPTEWHFGARAFMRLLLDRGYDVKIHSVRTHSKAFDLSGPNPERDADLAYIRKMLDDADLAEVEIVLDDKPPAVYYVDDRALRYEKEEGGFAALLHQIEQIEALHEAVKGDITDVAQEVTK